MLIYLSMILWVILMRIFCAGEMKYVRIPGGAKVYHVSSGVATITVSYIIFWAGIRTGGGDTSAYIRAFVANNSGLSDLCSLLFSGAKTAGWDVMLILFKNCISNNYHAWLMALAIFMGYAVARCYQRYSEAFFFCILIFILNGNQSWMLNGIRQLFCVCALMLALPWLIKGKVYHYMVLIACLSLIHFTVCLMAPLYFVLRLKPWSKAIWLAVAGVVCLCVLAEPLASVAEEALQSTSYAGSTVFNDGDDGVHPIRVLVAAVPAVLAWFNRKRIDAENHVLLNICINASLLSAMLYLFGVFTSGILMGRLPIYCEVFATMALPALINRFPVKAWRKPMVAGCIIFYALYFYVTLGNLYYFSDLTGFVPPLKFS